MRLIENRRLEEEEREQMDDSMRTDERDLSSELSNLQTETQSITESYATLISTNKTLSSKCNALELELQLHKKKLCNQQEMGDKLMKNKEALEIRLAETEGRCVQLEGVHP